MAFLEFHNITKTFGGVTALHDVSLAIDRGQIHALMGENGAGKSTLGKCLAGIHRPDSGHIAIEGHVTPIHNPSDAAAAGIGMVHQELAFCPNLSVAENLSLGHYPRRAGLFLSRRRMVQRARELLAPLGVSLDVKQPMADLSTAQEQVVQIAAAIGTGASILVFDEPTASLSDREAEQLFTLMHDLRNRGVTMIYVSHRLPEVFRLAHAISVLRDGRYVGTLTSETGEWPADARDKLVQMMIGRPLEDYLPQHTASAAGEPILEVDGLASPGKFADISFQLRPGEIVGLAGLVGAGRSEIARAIFGLDPAVTGHVRVNGSPLKLRSVRRAMRSGIALVPEDRKRQGLVLNMGGKKNFSLPLLRRLSKLGFLNFAEEHRLAAQYFLRLAVKTPSLSAPVASMSGGNQQKVVIAKWLAQLAGPANNSEPHTPLKDAPLTPTHPDPDDVPVPAPTLPSDAPPTRILLVDEPTRGVDIGAKAAIHHLLDELAFTGVAVLLISSELPEVINLSTRILVMREGRLVGEVPRNDATQEKLLRLMAGT